MGIAFDAPLALLLLPPLLAVVIALHLSSRRRLGKGRRRAALAVRALLLAALVGALAGLQLVLPVDRLAVVFVVDLSDSVGHGRAARRRSPTCASRSPRSRTRTWRGSSRSAADALVERLPVGARRDRPHRVDARAATRPTSAPRCGSPGPCSPTTPRSGSSSSRTATTPPAPASPRRRSPPRAGSRSRRVLIGLGGRDEVLVERLTAPSTARLGESIEVAARHHLDRRPARDRPPVRQRRAGRDPAGRPDGGHEPGDVHRSRPRTPGSCASGSSSRPARDTFNQNDRADANTIVKGEPQGARRQGRRGGRRRARDGARDRAARSSTRSSPRRSRRTSPGLADYDSIVLVDVPAAAPHGRGDGRAPGLRPRPRARARDGRRAAELRRGRLHRHAARGDAARRHGRPRPREAAGRRARRRHRQVGLDGRLPLQQRSTAAWAAAARDRRRRARSTSARRRSCGRRRR